MDQVATPETATTSDDALDVGALAEKLFAEEPEQGAESGKANAADTEEQDQPESEGSQEQADDQPRHKIKVNGEEIEVTLDELRKGYSREQDYSRKTAELAEQKRAYERQVQQAVANERKNLLSHAQQFVQLVESGMDPILAKGAKTDWAARMREDPVNGPAEKAEFDQRMMQYQRTRQMLETNAENEHLERVRWNHQELVKAWPEWGDDEKRPAIQERLRPHFKAYGFTDAEIHNVVDHRAFIAMRDAAAYREWKASIAKAKEKQVKEAPKVAAPKASKDEGSVSTKAKALEQKARSGKPSDVGAYAEALFA